MEKIEKFRFFQEMQEEDKKKYSSIVYSNCKKEIRAFSKTSKDYFKKELSGNEWRLFEDGILKNGSFTEAFSKKLIEKLDESRF